MRRYWDASAIIDALHDSRVERKLLEPDQWTRPHALVETFSTLTGGRLGFQYLAEDAAALIREISGGMNFVELDVSETVAALDAAQRRGGARRKGSRLAACASGAEGERRRVDHRQHQRLCWSKRWLRNSAALGLSVPSPESNSPGGSLFAAHQMQQRGANSEGQEIVDGVEDDEFADLAPRFRFIGGADVQQ
jgi:hypothetical protein